MKKIQKPIGVFLSLIMLFTLFNAAAVAEDVGSVTTETVTYIDENGEPQTVEAIVAVPGTHYASAETGWYVIEGTYSGSDHSSGVVASTPPNIGSYIVVPI